MTGKEVEGKLAGTPAS